MASDLRVLIAGSGLAGLMFGIMLERAGIEYLILERSSQHRPLGSAIQLNGTVLRLFEQLGMIDEINAISKSSGRLHVVNEHASTQGYVDFEHFYERYGYYSKVFARPDLHHLLVSKIPPERLIMGKRILSTQQNDLGVMVRCQDGTSYHADILVGADGAYSSVRAAIFKELKDKSLLPRSDSEPMRFDQHCVVGVTEPLDPEEFPILKQQFCEIHAVLGKKSPYSIYLVPVTGNRFAWSIGGQLPQNDPEKQGQNHSYAEWKPENAEDICNMVRDFALPELSLGRNPLHINSATSLPDPHSAFSLAQQHHSSSQHNDDESICTRSTGSERYSDPADPSAPAVCRPASLRSASASVSHLPHDQRSIVDPEMLNDPDIPHKSKYRPPARPGTVGRLIDATPVELISKVLLEEKFFKSWYCGRSVLIGDACHKLLPFAGQGAIQAFLDGISLANKLYDLKSTSTADIQAAFKAYTEERIPVAKSSISGSRSLGRLLHKQGVFSDLLRKVTFNHVPTWMLHYTSDKMHTHRPQLSYLPIVPDRGSAKANAQHYSPRYLAERAQGIHPRPLRSYSVTEHQAFQKQHQDWHQQQQQKQQNKRNSLLVSEQRRRRSLIDEQHPSRRRQSHDEKRYSPSPERQGTLYPPRRPNLVRHVTEPLEDEERERGRRRGGGEGEGASDCFLRRPPSLSVAAQFYQDLMQLPADSLPRPLGSVAQRSPPTTKVASQQIMPLCPPRSASLPPKVSTAPLQIVSRSSRSNTLSSRCSNDLAEDPLQQPAQRAVRWSQDLEECLEVLPVIESDEDEDNEDFDQRHEADVKGQLVSEKAEKFLKENEEYDFDDDNSLYVDGFDMPADQISATLSQGDHKLVTKDNTVFAFPAPPPSICMSPLPSVATTPLPSIPSDDEEEDELLESGADDSYILPPQQKSQTHLAGHHHHHHSAHGARGMLTPPSTEEIVTSARLQHQHQQRQYPQHQQQPRSPRLQYVTDPLHLPEMSVAEHQHLLQLSQHINQVHHHHHHSHGHSQQQQHHHNHQGHFGQHHHPQPPPHYHGASSRVLPPGGVRPPRDPHHHQHRPFTPLPGMSYPSPSSSTFSSSSSSSSSSSTTSSAALRLQVEGRVLTKSHSSASLRPMDETRHVPHHHQHSPLSQGSGGRRVPPRLDLSKAELTTPSYSCPASPTTAPYTPSSAAQPAGLEASLAAIQLDDRIPVQRQ